MDRDELARVINPHAFAHWEGMVAHCLRTGDSQEDAERWATMTYGPNMEAARDQADAVLTYFREYLRRDETVEVAARAIAAAKGIDICNDASYRHSTFGPQARAAINAIGGTNG